MVGVILNSDWDSLKAKQRLFEIPIPAPSNQQLIPTTKSKRKKKNHKNKDKMFRLVLGAENLNKRINVVMPTNNSQSPPTL